MVVVDCDLFQLIRTFLCSFLNASSSECVIASFVKPHASLISSGVHGCMILRQQFLISSALSVIWILSLSRPNSSQNRLWEHLKFVQGSESRNLLHIIYPSSIGVKLVLFSKLTESEVTNGMTLANSRLLSALR